MEAMFITRNALFCLPKSSPQVPSLSLHKSSRVVFPSASNYSSWRNVTEGSSRGLTAWTYDSTKTRSSNDDAAKTAKDAVSEGSKKIEELAGTIIDKTKEGGEFAKEKSDENAASVKDALKSAEDNAKEVADSVVDKIDEATKATKDAIKNS
nr:hypothetical protein [Caragana jubata]